MASSAASFNDWMSKPWDKEGIFFDVERSNGTRRRRWFDPLVFTHLLLFFSALILWYKGHRLQSAIVFAAGLVSLTYHKNVECCYESMDIALSTFTSMSVFLTAHLYGSKYLKPILLLSVISLFAWWFAAKKFIPKANWPGRQEYPGNHPHYCSMHSLFHLLAFSAVLLLCFFIEPTDCSGKKDFLIFK